jgi:hypothetical protein
MSEEKKPGQGWERRPNDVNAYQATFTVPKKPDAIPQTAASSGTTINTNQQVRVISNNKTGAIQLYEVRPPAGDRLFSTFNPSTGKWVSPTNDPEALKNIENKIGSEGIQKLQTQAKQGTVNGVINPTSTNEDKRNILNTEGYKSANNTIKTDPNENGGEEGANAAPIDLNQAGSNLKGLSNALSFGEQNRKVNQYPNSQLLKYPITLNLDEQDCIQFTMLQYDPKVYDLQKLASTGTIGARTVPGKRGAGRGSTVTLPIQPGISDTNTVDWGANTMDAPTLIAASAALETILEGPSGAIDALKAVVDVIGGDAKSDIKKAVAADMSATAAGTKGLLPRVSGGIVNPNMELLFNGPQLRSFTFNFTFSAREPKESEVIRNIIRFFKQGMSVKRSNTDLFLSSPHTFEIKYLHKNKDHPWINLIKECALLNCSVNYTPAQNYATFIDGAMTSYELALQFTELEPIYDDDYGLGGGNGNETQIGY